MAYTLYSDAYVKQIERERKQLAKALERAVKALEHDASDLSHSIIAHAAAYSGRKVLDSIDLKY